MKRTGLILCTIIFVSNTHGQAMKPNLLIPRVVKATIILSTGDTLQENIYFKNDYYLQPYIIMADRYIYDDLLTPLQVKKFCFTFKRGLYEYISVMKDPLDHERKFIRQYYKGNRISLYGLTFKDYANGQSFYHHYYAIMNEDKWVDPLIGKNFCRKKDILEHVGKCPGLKEKVNKLLLKDTDIIEIFREYDEWVSSSYYIY